VTESEKIICQLADNGGPQYIFYFVLICSDCFLVAVLFFSTQF